MRTNAQKVAIKQANENIRAGNVFRRLGMESEAQHEYKLANAILRRAGVVL